MSTRTPGAPTCAVRRSAPSSRSLINQTWHCGGGTGWASSPPSRTVPLKRFAFRRLRKTEPRTCGQAVEPAVDNYTVVIRIRPPVRDSFLEHMCAQLCLERATTVRRCPPSRNRPALNPLAALCRIGSELRLVCSALLAYGALSARRTRRRTRIELLTVK